MNLKEAIKILEEHNEWRRYSGPVEDSPQMSNPTLIGEAIDYVAATINQGQTFGNSKLCEYCKTVGDRCECGFLGGDEIMEGVER